MTTVCTLFNIIIILQYNLLIRIYTREREILLSLCGVRFHSCSHFQRASCLRRRFPFATARTRGQSTVGIRFNSCRSSVHEGVQIILWSQYRWHLSWELIVCKAFVAFNYDHNQTTFCCFCSTATTDMTMTGTVAVQHPCTTTVHAWLRSLALEPSVGSLPQFPCRVCFDAGAEKKVCCGLEQLRETRLE